MTSAAHQSRSSRHPSLSQPEANLLGGAWVPFASPIDASRSLTSRNPARPSDIVWNGASIPEHVAAAVAAARCAAHEWEAWGLERRSAVLRRFQSICASRHRDMARLIRDETGKVEWDAHAEASLIAAKVDITLDPADHSGLRRVRGFDLPISPGRAGSCRFRPHGVMAVVGPFNFPMHLPNGHIVPALAMGNTIVFKPSDKTPACGQMLAELWHESLDAERAPCGVFNLVQGSRDVAQRLVAHEGVDGVLFTGSWAVGRAILQANLDHPGRVCALEMGGNNAAVIMPDADLRQATIECVRSAFVTTGQRCTCTRRLIVHESVADRVIRAVCNAASNLIVENSLAARADHPAFLGPLICKEARDTVLAAQDFFRRAGARSLLSCEAIDRDGWFLTPGVMRVDHLETGETGAGADIEVFGPLLRVCTVTSLADAIKQANATRFGLAAAIFSRDEATVAEFARSVRAGCVNINTGTAGASSKLPFGGLGHSGNHRPAGSMSLDYCAYPVAGIVESGGAAPIPIGMRFEDSWIL